MYHPSRDFGSGPIKSITARSYGGNFIASSQIFSRSVPVNRAPLSFRAALDPCFRVDVHSKPEIQSQHRIVRFVESAMPRGCCIVVCRQHPRTQPQRHDEFITRLLHGKRCRTGKRSDINSSDESNSDDSQRRVPVGKLERLLVDAVSKGVPVNHVQSSACLTIQCFGVRSSSAPRQQATSVCCRTREQPD